MTDADTEVRMRCAEAEIEQDRFAILRTKGLSIGIEFGQHGSAAHRAIADGGCSATIASLTRRLMARFSGLPNLSMTD